MPLTDTALRSLKPEDKVLRLYDGRGLLLLVEPSGARYWRYKYRINKKQKTLALGVYPEVSLRQAREKLEAARLLVNQGIDPAVQRRSDKLASSARAGNSFRAVAEEWYEKQLPTWALTHSSRVRRRLDMDVLPFLGSRPIADITAPELLDTMRRVERRTIETAHRVLRDCGQIFRYAIVTGRCARDTAADLRGALKPVQHSHMAATTDAKRLGAILRQMDAYPGGLIVASALKLVPLLFVRPGELRHAEWAAIDLDAAEWRFQASKQRTGAAKVDHIVPLSTQALAVLRDLHALTGERRLVFPSARDYRRPMSDNAVLVAMRSMEIGRDEMTGHGFRAVARTLLDEVLGFRPDIIEHQLAHAVKDPNGRAYNRTSHLEERRRMMQAWADYLDQLKRQVLVMPARRIG